MNPLSVPDLTTFGAIVRHSLDLERFAVELYHELSRAYSDASRLSEAFGGLETQHKARYRLLENTRREKLSEMILEPIEGLDGERYVPTVANRACSEKDLSGGCREEMLAIAIETERVLARFYLDSAAKARTVLAEAGRIFERLARESERNGEALASL